MKPIHVLIVRVAVACGSLGLGGCAHVTFHPAKESSDLPDTRQETGIKYYNSKPYLMVSYTGNKDAPVQVALVNLPDLDHPVYVMYHSGLGTHQFSLSVAGNGTLASYGQTVDSKVPETLTAIGSMASSLATGLKTTGIVKQAAPEDLAMSAVIEAIGQLQVITASMDQKNALVMTVNKQAFEAQRMLSDILQAMKSGNFDQKKALDGVLKNLKPLSIADTQGNPEAITINNAVKGAQDAVQKAMDALDKQSGGSAPKPDFRLFEIRSVGGVTTLVPVAIPGQ